MPSPALQTYAGLNFPGLLRLVTIYRRYKFNTRFNINPINSILTEYPIDKPPFYQYIVANNMSDGVGKCLRVYGDEKRCESCSAHNFPNALKQCFSSCPFDSFGATCSKCHKRCKYCNGYKFVDCLECQETEQGMHSSSWVFGNFCYLDFGYYFNSKLKDYEQCDDRCLTCTDSSNVCAYCTPGRAYRAYGGQCLS